MELVCKGRVLGGALRIRMEAVGRGGAGTCPLVTLVQKQLWMGSLQDCASFFLTHAVCWSWCWRWGWVYVRKSVSAFPGMLFAAEMKLQLQSEWQHLPQPRAKPALK